MNTRTWLSGCLLLSILCGNATFLPAETQNERDARMAWFRDARFGLFIHWGVYAVPAGEWAGKTDYGEWFLEQTKMPVSQYEKFASQFNPVKFDAREWVRMAKNAGMKYVVITSKHHDGFGIYPSDLTDWCIKSTPFKRDPLKELADACRAEGLRLCFYHSIMDWHHPDWATRRPWNDKASGTPDMDRYVAFMKGQLKELITRYGPIGILWFDGEWESPWTHERGLDLYNYVRSLQPDIIINNRVGKGRAGMGGMDQGAERVGDYGTPEQEIPPTGFGPGVDWESCMTMNDHWGFNKNDNHWKPTQVLIRNLIDCASKGGNYLLNVGPTAEGTFPQPSIDRLREIGEWMAINSEAIYGTTASPFTRLPWGRCTTKTGPGNETTLYLHVFDWPENGQLLIPGLKTVPTRAALLTDTSRKELPCSAGPDGFYLALPPQHHPISTTVVLNFRSKPEVESFVLRQQADGTVNLPAVEARTHGSLRYETGEKRDNIGFWLNPADYVDWEFKLNRPGSYTVKATLAAPQASSFEIVCAGQRLTAKAPVTGDYGNFQTVDLGALTLSASGKLTIEIRPLKDSWQPINLKGLVLQPR